MAACAKISRLRASLKTLTWFSRGGGRGGGERERGTAALTSRPDSGAHRGHLWDELGSKLAKREDRETDVSSEAKGAGEGVGSAGRA